MSARKPSAAASALALAGQDQRPGRAGRALVWPWTLIACCLLPLATPPGLAQEADQELLRNARMWQARNRNDLSRQALTKLLSFAPDHLEALEFLADMELRANHIDAARAILLTLKSRHPKESVTLELQDALRVYDREHEKLARMRLLARAGRKAQAAGLARELFPQGPPHLGGLDLEYAQLVGVPVPAKPQLASAAGAAGATSTTPPVSPPSARTGRSVAPAPAVAARAAASPSASLSATRSPAPAMGLAAVDLATAAPSKIDATRSPPVPQDVPAPTQARAEPALPALSPASSIRPLQPIVTQLQSEAQAQLAAGQLDTATQTLNQALNLSPDDPWLRHDLARLLLRRQQPAQALALMDEGVERRPGLIDMRFARALVRSSQDDANGALEDMAHIPVDERSPGMLGVIQRASVQSLLRQAQTADSPTAALEAMGQAEQRAGNDADLLAAVSNAWFRLGQDAQGVDVFKRRLARALPDDPSERAELSLRHADFLNRAQDDAGLAQHLPKLYLLSGWRGDPLRQLLDISADHRARQVEQALAGADGEQARRLLQAPWPELHASDLPDERLQAWLRKAQAQTWTAGGEHAQALALLQSAWPLWPDDVEMRLALARAQLRQGERQAAREQALWLHGHIPAEQQYQRLALLRLWQGLNAGPQAQDEAQRLLARFPGDREVLMHAARLARSQGRYSDALGYFAQAQHGDSQTQARWATSSMALAPSPVGRDIEAIESRRQAWIEVGQDLLHKKATDGISSLRGWERPVVAWFPWRYDGKVFVHVDQVHLSAGALPASGTDLLSFGQVLAWPPAALASSALASQSQQTADGFNVGLGYVGDRLRWDIGQTGAGMPVRNWVGGLRLDGDAGRISYALELARRPLTGSLLAYAGTRDPITGQVWGGVVATGLNGRLSTELGGYTVSGSASWAHLSGREVMGNTRLQGRGEINRDVLREPHQRVNLGLAVSVWRYAQDLSAYSWGHGGYYSPQQYLSLALPLDWSGRRGLFSWQLRASASLSQVSRKDMDFYPQRPDLQAQALGQPAALAGQPTPVYGGGRSASSAFALRAAMEYQLTPKLALGTRLELDRTAYYAPTNLMVYLRYLFDPLRGVTLADRPQPVQAYSRF